LSQVLINGVINFQAFIVQLISYGLICLLFMDLGQLVYLERVISIMLI